MDIITLTANKIKEIRISLGLTAESVAADLHISKSAYSELENGHTDITLKKLQAIASLWNIDIAALIQTPTLIRNIPTDRSKLKHLSPEFFENFSAFETENLIELLKTLLLIIK